MTPIRVFIVDDSPAFIDSAIRTLAAHPDVEVVGRAGSGREALLEVKLLRPDLVLMDLAMGAMGGLETTRAIKKLPARPRVVIVTLHDLDIYRGVAEAAGADGFVAKAAFSAEVPSLIDRLFPAHGTHGSPGSTV
jgi:DNA-binding NarL/FixJ family response regulator